MATTALQVKDDEDYAILFYGRHRKRARTTKPVIKKNINKDIEIYHDNQCFKKLKFRLSSDVISGCASVEDQYETLDIISSGGFGGLHRARDNETGEIVAIKGEFDGLSETSYREIEILNSLDPHPSVVQFKRLAFDDLDGVYIVMEYLENDLRRYMKDYSKPFSPSEVKCLMKQLLEGVKFLHYNGVMHRDLKPSNILMNGSQELKICDFGLSRYFGSLSRSYTPIAGTLWYKAPELFLGMTVYSSAIDMWSVGCVMAELLLKEVLFQGDSEISQMEKIYGILGTPNEDIWPGFCSLPVSKIKFGTGPYCNILRNKIRAGVLTEVGFDLLKKLLTYDPAKRITAEAALNHDWFKEE